MNQHDVTKDVLVESVLQLNEDSEVQAKDKFMMQANAVQTLAQEGTSGEKRLPPSYSQRLEKVSLMKLVRWY